MTTKLLISLYKILFRIGRLPFCRNFGASRGQPIGRFYVEKFLFDNSDVIKGKALEFGDDSYRSFFPGIASHYVVSAYSGEYVDFQGDIHQSSLLPSNYFDGIICTQVLEHLEDPLRALINLHSSLKCGGVIIITVPFMQQVHNVPSDYYRFTIKALDRLLKLSCYEVEELTAYGNAMVSIGSLLGFTSSDFKRSELYSIDSEYPYTICALARKPL
jgi:SAM-dependent methyltransferase